MVKTWRGELERLEGVGNRMPGGGHLKQGSAMGGQDQFDRVWRDRGTIAGDKLIQKDSNIGGGL